MEPLQTKPVYHHPIPWQVVVSLVLLGVNVLSLALQASTTLIAYTVAPEPVSRLVLAFVIAMALALVANATLAVCIAARLNWARVLAIALYLLACLYSVPIAVGFSFVPLAIAADLDGVVLVPAYLDLAFCLAVLFMLHNENATAYTYRGGGASWPET